jgi:hypothetical protein
MHQSVPNVLVNIVDVDVIDFYRTSFFKHGNVSENTCTSEKDRQNNLENKRKKEEKNELMVMNDDDV